MHSNDVVSQGIATGYGFVAKLTNVAGVGHVTALDVFVHVVLVLALVAAVRAFPSAGEL